MMIQNFYKYWTIKLHFIQKNLPFFFTKYMIFVVRLRYSIVWCRILKNCHDVNHLTIFNKNLVKIHELSKETQGLSTTIFRYRCYTTNILFLLTTLDVSVLYTTNTNTQNNQHILSLESKRNRFHSNIFLDKYTFTLKYNILFYWTEFKPKIFYEFP